MYIFTEYGCGPETTDDLYDFQNRLFSDKDIIPSPAKNYVFPIVLLSCVSHPSRCFFFLFRTLGPVIARRRTPSIEEQYGKIGGGSRQ